MVTYMAVIPGRGKVPTRDFAPNKSKHVLSDGEGYGQSTSFRCLNLSKLPTGLSYPPSAQQ